MKSFRKSLRNQTDKKEIKRLCTMLSRIDPWWLTEMSECVGAFQAIERVAELGDSSLIEPLTDLLKTQDWHRRFDIKEALERAVEKIKDSNRNILSKLIRSVFVSKSKHNEICAGCGRRLPVSVQACVYKGRILCEECDRDNRAHAERVEQAQREHEQDMVKFEKEWEEKKKRKLVEAQEMIKQGNPFGARDIMRTHSCEPELWKQLGECFEKKGLLQSAIIVYSREGQKSERDRVADRLGLTGHFCEKHGDRPAIGRCESCQGYFCIACGDECANHFACKSCLAMSRRDWMNRVRRSGILREI